MPNGTAAQALSERLSQRVVIDPASGCHLWTGHLNQSGYGIMSVGNRLQRTHRVAYQLAKGAVPVGLQLDHLCRNRACCNPDHLEAVTLQENLARGRALRQTCKRGHPYNEENTLYAKQGRFCRVCRRLMQARTSTRSRAKLTAGDVLEIRRRSSSGETHAAIATAFPVGARHIGRIASGEKWAHLQ